MTQTFTDPLPQEIEAFRDNDWSFEAAVTQAEDGSAVDLSSWNGWFAMKDRDTYSDDQILIFKRTDVAGEGEIQLPTAAGLMTFYFFRADTKDLKAGTYFWDFGIFRGDEKITCGRGQLELKQPILHGDIPA